MNNFTKQYANKREQEEVIPIGKKKVEMPQVEFDFKAITKIKKRKKRVRGGRRD